eukprot:scaffold53918_cov111-Cyclotella_meneghiniana.AAC.1
MDLLLCVMCDVPITIFTDHPSRSWVIRDKRRYPYSPTAVFELVTGHRRSQSQKVTVTGRPR